MKIIFLHLSDLHLRSTEGANPIKIQAAVQSLSIFGAFEGVIIVVSGDITATGSENEYKIAATFLGRISDEIEKKYSISKKNLKILLVPGNHDIYYGGDSRPSSEEIKKYSVEELAQKLLLDIERMSNCFLFLDRNGCFFKVNKSSDTKHDQLVTRKVLHFDNGYRVEANLINSAPFSCQCDEGLHYLPGESILQVSQSSSADISILVMHHSPDWFNFSQKKDLENIIAQRCSIAFYGHEHILGAQQIIYDNGDKIIQQAGGAWWRQSAQTVSEYYAALFDSDSRNYSLHKFSWDSSVMGFINTLQRKESLMLKPLNGCGLAYCESYLSELMNDVKHSVSKDISDFFVFPDLKINVSKEYTNGKTIREMHDLIAYIKNNKYVAIVGGSNSGKTMLLKMLFKTLSRDMTVLYCCTDDITGRNQENIIKELVRNTYGENSYSLYQQMNSSSKAIIIDDLHRISPRHLNKFLRGIESLFDIIVVATEETAQFDVVQMVKDNISSAKEFNKLSIKRFYAEKRLEVITKVVSLKEDGDEASKKNLARVLEQSLNTYKLAFRAEIDFVVQFADYYCTHIGELDKSDATVFSKVFEASIERAIIPNIIRGESVNDIIVALSEVAHHIHFEHEYPISAERIRFVIENYCDYYDNRHLTPARFIEITEQSNLIIKTSNGFQYRLRSKDHLAYFVAKALNRKFHDTGDSDNLALVVEQSCFGINGDVLMFLTYIADNVNIPRLLLSQAQTYTQTWSEFSFADKNIKYLLSMSEDKLPAPDNNQKEKEVIEQARNEELDDDVIETLDLYDYDISRLGDLHYQIIRAFLQLRIIARSLSAFISILPAPDKQNLVCAMYQMPNKIFNQWAGTVDNNINSLIEELMKWQESEEYEGKKFTRENALKFLQGVSLDLLLNLYYLVTLHGVNANTVDYLSQQNYVPDSLNYQIERLMFFEKVDDYHSVLQEAEHIYNTNTDGMIKNMVVAILRHTIIYSDRITDRERRRIADQYFPPKTKAHLLIERQKAIKSKNI